MAAALLAATLACAACSSIGSGSPQASPSATTPAIAGSPPPGGSAPPLPSSSPGLRATAPVVWIGGTLAAVTQDEIRVRETAGPEVATTRLAEGATTFYEAAAGAWQRLDSRASVRTGGPVCVETLMDGSNLLALRVFLGATCGPA